MVAQPRQAEWGEPEILSLHTGADHRPSASPQGTRVPSASGQSVGQADEPARPSAPQADISFLRDASGVGPAKSRLRRAVSGFLALALLALLAGQMIWMERDRLLAMFPQSRPALQWMCDHLGCTLAALRQIESVVIESSSFNKAKGDAYRLTVGLRNTAGIDVALPSIELTLTDSQDQALFRRVLAPGDLGRPVSAESALAAGTEWQGQATLTVRMAAQAERFTGYRVLAFYP